MTRTRTTEWLASLAEALGALGATVALTLALTLVLMVAVLFFAPPAGFQAEVSLRSAEGRSATAVTHDELIQRLRERRIAERVDIVRGEDTDRLVLRGVITPDLAEIAVLTVLAEGGYQTGTVEFAPALDPVAFLQQPFVLVPGLAIQALVFFAVGALMMRLRVPSRRTSFPGIGAITYGVLGGVTAVLAGAGLGLLLEWLGLPVEEQPLLAELLRDPANQMRLIPWIVLAAPLAEEVFFRGYLFRFLALRTGFPAGVLVSSLLFAAVHLNLSGFLVYVVVGCVFALSYARTSHLATPITAHVVYNGVLMTALALTP